MNTFYTYVHAKPTGEGASSIFYVGKGSLRRSRLINRGTKNRHYSNTVAKYGAENILIGRIECSSEEISFELERGLIKCLRSMGVQLTNLTDGGEGSSGFKPTAETLAKLQEASSSVWARPGYKDKMSEIQKRAQKTALFSDKKRNACLLNAEKARASRSTPEVKEASSRKNSAKSLEMWANENIRKSIMTAQKNYWSPEKREAKSAEITGRIRVTNGIEERNVKQEEVARFLEIGWRKGRKPRVLSKRARS